MEPRDFLRETQTRDRSQENVRTVVVETGRNDPFEINLYTDKDPRYWTSFDDQYIHFDAYNVDNGRGSTLSPGDVQIVCVDAPSFNIYSDTDKIPVPDNFDPYFINSCISLASEELRQMPNDNATQIARRQYIKLRELSTKARQDRKFIDYGKKPGRTVRNSSWSSHWMGSEW